jgi:hypothetical protein
VFVRLCTRDVALLPALGRTSAPSRNVAVAAVFGPAPPPLLLGWAYSAKSILHSARTRLAQTIAVMAGSDDIQQCSDSDVPYTNQRMPSASAAESAFGARWLHTLHTMQKATAAPVSDDRSVAWCNRLGSCSSGARGR